MFISNFKYQISNIKLFQSGFIEIKYSGVSGFGNATVKYILSNLRFEILNPNGVGSWI